MYYYIQRGQAIFTGSTCHWTRVLHHRRHHLTLANSLGSTFCHCSSTRGAHIGWCRNYRWKVAWKCCHAYKEFRKL